MIFASGTFGYSNFLDDCHFPYNFIYKSCQNVRDKDFRRWNIENAWKLLTLGEFPKKISKEKPPVLLTLKRWQKRHKKEEGNEVIFSQKAKDLKSVVYTYYLNDGSNNPTSVVSVVRIHLCESLNCKKCLTRWHQNSSTLLLYHNF